MMKKGFCFLFILLLSFGEASASQEKSMPPQLGKRFLEKLYVNKTSKKLYSMMSASYKQEVPFSKFKQKDPNRQYASFGAKFEIKAIRQEALPSNEGLLYYKVSVLHPPFLFKKNLFALEKLKFIQEPNGWKIKEQPKQLFSYPIKEKPSKKVFYVLQTLMENDARKELISASRHHAISRSLNTARKLSLDGQFRLALIEYEKVLKLDAEHSEAAAEKTFCQQQLSRHENTH